MIKLKRENKRAKEEEEKKTEEVPNQTIKQKKPPGEIRLQKEIQELDVPGHAKVIFKDDGSIMSFKLEVDLKGE